KNPRHKMLARQCVLPVARIVAMQDVSPEDSLEALLASKHFKMKTHQGTAPRKAQIYEGGSMSCKRRHVH
ncbi:hypothetical protein LI253_18770, partial [Gordonibacter pamelaeae]|nr:hypothetical protein [Gordonibacter pamelaeae]